MNFGNMSICFLPKYTLVFLKMRTDDDSPRGPRIDRSSKKRPKIKQTDGEEKHELKRFKQQKQKLIEEEEDWENWREHYNT